MDDPHHILVKAQYDELSGKYPDLSLEHKDGMWVIKGSLDFYATYEEIKIRESFQVEMLIPKDYPNILPIVKETSGNIPRTFHKYDDDSLCLGAPTDVHKKFSEKPSLLGFVDNLVIPYLFSFSYHEQHGVMPYGELSHGGKGLIEYYTDYLGVNSEFAVLSFLKTLASDNYRGHHDCPCGSGKKIRRCHGKELLELKMIQNPYGFLRDYLIVLGYMKNAGIELPKNLMNEKDMALIKKGLKLYSGKKL